MSRTRSSSTSPSSSTTSRRWSKPNTFDAFNARSRWRIRSTQNGVLVLQALTATHSIDEDVIYPYGAALDANVEIHDARTHPRYPWPMAAISDYRSPGELRIDVVGEALIAGGFDGKLLHDVAGGASLFIGVWFCRRRRATGLLFSWSADLIAIVALLGTARFALALAGMDGARPSAASARRAR